MSFKSSNENVSKLNANATSFLKGEKDITLICIHGFTGVSSDFSIVANYLNKKFNINCLSLSLPGHTGNIDDLQSIRHTDWLNAIIEQIDHYSSLQHQVHLMGLSMGGALSMIIASKMPESVHSLTLFSPALWTRSSNNDFILFALSKLPRSFIPNMLIEKNKKANEELLFDEYPLHSLAEYKKVTLLAKKAISKLQCPSLILYSEDDDVIRPESSRYIFKYYPHSSKKIVQLKHAGHILPMIQDEEQKLMLKELDLFYKKVF